MAKFILSNVLDSANSVVENTKSVGFVESGKYVAGGDKSLIFSSFCKLSVEGENYLKLGDDFVSVTGTCIYKEEIGIDALKSIYEDFEGEKSISAVREGTIGNCAFIIKKGNKIYVFCETYAIYSIYYTISGSDFAISNSLTDVASIIFNGSDWDNLYEDLCFATIYCGGTPFKDTYRLTDDKYIVIDCDECKAVVGQVKSQWVSDSNKPYSDIVKDVAKNLIESARIVSKCFGVPALCSTGGLDSRVNLSSFLANGVKPELYYGKGNSTITNTDNEDNEINKIYKERFGLDYHLMSWLIPDPLNRDWEDSYAKYGLGYGLYSGSKDIYATFETIRNRIIFFGSVGEMYRNLDFIENLKGKTFTIDEYIEHYLYTLFDSKEIIIPDDRIFRSTLKSKLNDICKKWNINPQSIKSQEEQYLSMERRNNGDSGYINWVNYHHYCLSILAQPKVMRDVMRLDGEQRMQGRFMLDVLNQIYPEILAVPVYTHRQRKTYDKERNVLVAPQNKTLLERFLDFGRPIQKRIISNKVGRTLVFKIYWLLLNDEKKNQIKEDQESLKMLEKIIEENGWKRGVNYGTSKNGRILMQLKIAQCLLAFKKVKETNNLYNS